ncbi:hypothetical protein EGT07_07985 [Herbaspirillum sp. HC18]|nr:hypothetical protein EGT07_07985 [Herbaspirillum sp. HC18]
MRSEQITSGEWSMPIEGRDFRRPRSAASKISDEERYQTDRTVIIRKSEKAQIRVERGIWNGVEVIDLRLWRRFKGTGSFVPTKKAITVDIGMREALIQALEAMSGLAE